MTPARRGTRWPLVAETDLSAQGAERHRRLVPTVGLGAAGPLGEHEGARRELHPAQRGSVEDLLLVAAQQRHGAGVDRDRAGGVGLCVLLDDRAGDVDDARAHLEGGGVNPEPAD